MSDEEYVLPPELVAVVDALAASHGGYGADAVADLEAMLEDRSHTDTPDEKERCALVQGVYLGEAMRRAYGGKWIKTDDGLELELGERGVRCWPMKKVWKRLTDGDQHNVIAYFNLNPKLVERLTKAGKRVLLRGDEDGFVREVKLVPDSERGE